MRAKLVIRVRLHIREIAEQRNISRSKLSHMADLNYNTIRDLWKDEVKDVQVTTLAKIAKALKVPITDLFTTVDYESE